MQTRLSLAFAVLTISAASTLYAQTQAPAQSNTTAAPAYQPQQQQPAPPQPAPAQPVPAEPIPQVSPSPVVPPATTSPQTPYGARPQYGIPDEDRKPDHLGSVYIPVDNWMYNAITQLYSMGYCNTLFLGMRPWTRRSVLHVLQESRDDIEDSENELAKDLLHKLLSNLSTEVIGDNVQRGAVYGLESAYTRFTGIGGTTLRDSFHLGQTISNDYGRPYMTGFNNITGFSSTNELGRFSLYVRGEYQHAPSGSGYSPALGAQISAIDAIPYYPPNFPQDTIPSDPVASQNYFRLVEATASFHWWGHEFSAGKSDAWLGPAAGGAMAWSNNAEDIYSVRINRVEPMYIPLLSKVLGPLRYDFFYGSLKGHTEPNSPYVNSLEFSFRPTKNFEFAFQRTIIFGGKEHAPVTIHTFLNGFFDFSDTTVEEKFSREDPGARFSDFTFSYRLPFVRNYATLYLDSIAHDDVTPISAPRRAAYRTGVYISQFPGKLRKLDFRAEGVTTDPGVSRSQGGTFNYFETVQRQGYTNKGFLMADWIGREAKGGQAMFTYHLSGNEWVQVAYLNKKNPKDFIPDGTTQNQFKVSVVKRVFRPDVELNASFQYEGWKAPIYKPGLNKNTVTSFQLTWYPRLRTYPKQIP